MEINVLKVGMFVLTPTGRVGRITEVLEGVVTVISGGDVFRFREPAVLRPAFVSH
jgi:hypothetical protein